MSSLMGRIFAFFQVVLLLTVVGACSSDDSSLPAGTEILQKSAAVTEQLTSLALAVTTEKEPSLTIQGGDVELLKSGDAKGTLKLMQSGQLVEVQFVLLGDTVHFKGVTGGYQKVPRGMVTAVYDPSAVLDGSRGLARLLTTAAEPETEDTEKVGGRNAYRVKTTLSKETAGTLLPGVTSDLPAKLWIAADDSRLLKLEAEVPASAGGGEGSVTVTFSDFNSAFKITAPE